MTVENNQLECGIWDRVLFGKYAGTEIKIDDVEYVIMREEEILAVLTKGK